MVRLTMNRGILRMLLDPTSKGPKYALVVLVDVGRCWRKFKITQSRPEVVANVLIFDKIETLVGEEHKMGFGWLPTVVTNFKT